MTSFEVRILGIELDGVAVGDVGSLGRRLQAFTNESGTTGAPSSEIEGTIFIV